MWLLHDFSPGLIYLGRNIKPSFKCLLSRICTLLDKFPKIIKRTIKKIPIDQTVDSGYRISVRVLPKIPAAPLPQFG